MREGAVLDRIAAGQRIGDEVLRAQVGADFAIATDLKVIREVRTFADERDTSVQ